MTDEPIKAINILYNGSVAKMNTAALNAAAVAGIMKVVNPDVNMVSAPIIAKERGINISTTTQEKTGVFDAYIKLTVVTDRARTVHCRHCFQRWQAALHPDQGHHHRRRDRPAHALHHERGRARHHRHARSDDGREWRQHRQLHPRSVRTWARRDCAALSLTIRSRKWSWRNCGRRGCFSKSNRWNSRSSDTAARNHPRRDVTGTNRDAARFPIVKRIRDVAAFVLARRKRDRRVK